MKHTIITILLFCCLYTTAQQKIDLGRNMIVTLPQGSVKFNDQEFRNELLLTLPIELVESLTANSYKNGNIILRFQSVKYTPQANFIQEKKKFFDNNLIRPLHKDSTLFKSKISTINGNSVLIVTKNLNTKTEVEYYCYHSQTGSAFRGIIQGPPNMMQRSIELTRAILNQVKFE